MKSPAKINWNLRIVGRRSDGYHLIDSIFIPIFDLCDDVHLELELNTLLNIKVSGRFADRIPKDETNLAFKALKSIGTLLNLDLGGLLTIDKHIPVSAGLGGGSSNAATVLLLARQSLLEYNFTITDEQLHAIALSLGADVPFFLNPQVACVQGIGEKITPSEFRPKGSLLLITPDFPISAKSAYTLFDRSKEKYTNPIASFLAMNDLGKVLRRKYMALDVILNTLKEYGASDVLISGSGPTCIGIFEDERVAQEALNFISAELFTSNFNFFLTNL